MSIFQLAGSAVAVCALILVIKQQKPEIALLAGAAIGIFILGAVIPQMGSVIETISKISQNAGINNNYTSIMLKAVGVAYIANLGGELCRDAGQGAIASKVELAGKIIIAVLGLPVIDALFSMISGVM